MDGIATTQHIKQIRPEMKVVMLTTHPDQSEVVAALVHLWAATDMLYAAIPAGGRLVEPTS